MFTIDRWDDLYGDEMYITVGLNMKECVDAKRNATSELTYIMDCANGFEVYTVDSEDGTRNLTDAEREEVLDWITEQFDMEKMMDDLYAACMDDREVQDMILDRVMKGE